MSEGMKRDNLIEWVDDTADADSLRIDYILLRTRTQIFGQNPRSNAQSKF